MKSDQETLKFRGYQEGVKPVEFKTRQDVLDHAWYIFDEVPWLVDLVLALADSERHCMVSLGRDNGGSVQWPPVESV